VAEGLKQQPVTTAFPFFPDAVFGELQQKEAAVPVLIKLLGHHDAYDLNYDPTQSAAEGLLTTIGVPAVPALRGALRSKNPEVRGKVSKEINAVGREDKGEEGLIRP
jgi:hypothetical protein